MAIDTINPTIRQKGESIQAFAAFEAYNADRRIPAAYNNFMSANPDALTTIKGFISWASKYEWQARVNLGDIMEELEIRRQTRVMGGTNSRTAEEISKELMAVCMDEFDLRKDQMTPADIARFMKIGVGVNDRWIAKNQPSVIVNVDSSATATIEVSDEVLRELGKKMSEKQDANSA